MNTRSVREDNTRDTDTLASERGHPGEPRLFAGEQHVTSPRSSRDGLQQGNERVRELSRTPTPETPLYP